MLPEAKGKVRDKLGDRVQVSGRSSHFVGASMKKQPQRNGNFASQPILFRKYFLNKTLASPATSSATAFK